MSPCYSGVNIPKLQFEGQKVLRIKFLRGSFDTLQVGKVHDKEVSIFAGSVLEFFEGCFAFRLITGSDPNFGVLG